MPAKSFFLQDICNYCAENAMPSIFVYRNNKRLASLAQQKSENFENQFLLVETIKQLLLFISFLM